MAAKRYVETDTERGLPIDRATARILQLGLLATGIACLLGAFLVERCTGKTYVVLGIGAFVVAAITIYTYGGAAALKAKSVVTGIGAASGKQPVEVVSESKEQQ